MTDNVRHVVAVSGGKDSTALALRLREINPATEYEYVFTPTGNEPAALFGHIDRLRKRLGGKWSVITAAWKEKQVCGWQQWRPQDGLVDCIRRNQAIPNFRMRFCTRQLKIEPAIHWFTEHAPLIQYVGLRADEEGREGIYGTIPGVEQCYPFQQWGWNEEDIWDYLESRSVTVPRRTDCEWCFYQWLLEWKNLWRDNPDSYAKGEALEEEMGHTFRSPGRDSKPAALKDLREEVFEKGVRVRGEDRADQLTLFNCDRDAMCRVCSL